MRKLIYGTLALSAALAAGFGVGAKDAEAARSDYMISIDNNELSIAVSGQKDIFVAQTSLVTFDRDNKNIAYPKPATAWDAYTATNAGDAIKINLSKYSEKKDTFFLVKYGLQEDSEAVLVMVPKSPTFKSVTWGADGKLTLTDSDNKTIEDATANAYMVSDGKALLYDNAKKYDLSDWEKYSYTGAALTVSKAVTAAPASGEMEDYKYSSSDTYTKFVTSKTSKDDEIDTFQTASRTGIPVKLNVPKRANAPKVTADYANGNIKINAGIHFDFMQEGANASDAPAAFDIYGTEKDGSTAFAKKKDTAIEDTGDIYGKTSGVVNEFLPSGKARVFWVGTLGSGVKEADKEFNFVLSPTQGRKFYADVYTTDRNYSKSKSTRFLFKPTSQTTDVERESRQMTGNAVDSLDNKVEWTSKCETNGYTIYFNSCDLVDAYTIKITDYTDMKDGKPAEKTLKLGKATAKGKSGDEANIVKKLATQKYATKLKIKADFEAALKATDADKGIKITIQRNGNKATSEWPGTIEAFGETTTNDFSTSRMISSIADDTTIGLPAYANGDGNNAKFYKGSTYDEMKEENEITTSEALPGAKVIIATEDMIKISYKDSKKSLKTIKTSEVKDTSGKVVGRAFTMPAVGSTDLEIEPEEFEITVPDGVSVYYADDLTAAADSEQVVGGRTIYIEKETEMKDLKVKIGNKDVTVGTESANSKNYYTFVLTGDAKVTVEKKTYKITVKGDGIKFYTTLNGTALKNEIVAPGELEKDEVFYVKLDADKTASFDPSTVATKVAEITDADVYKVTVGTDAITITVNTKTTP